MSTDLNNSNTWSTSTAALKQGVERFNISVEGDATQFSSLASLQSTNNTLKEVNVVSKTGSVADLIIGNHNSTVTPLKDVQTFNATGFKGNLTLNAAITGETIAKYIKLKDGAPALAETDNVAFVYTAGAGNDTLNVQIDALAAGSRNIGGLEDFTFKIDGGAGKDTIMVTLDSIHTLTGNGQAWYNNQDLNNNVTVNGGEGDDTITTSGAGDMKINGDAGADTIYTDNTGNNVANAQWVFNTADQTAAGVVQRSIADLRSDTNETFILPQSNLSVTFKGLVTASIAIPGTGLNKTDLQINQAIKKAINDDAVLSKLLVAVDGPANTLVVKSLIDGAMASGDLQIAITLPKAGTLSATEIASAGVAFKMAVDTATEATVLAAMGLELANYTSYGDYVGAFGTNGVANISGAISTSTSDNLVSGGAGNDVIVLGTTLGASMAASSNETLVFGAGFGDDTVVNFAAAGMGADRLDFSGIGGTALGLVTADKSIVVSSTAIKATSALTVEAQVAAKFDADNVAAQSHVFVLVSGTVGTVYSVLDAAGKTNAVATKEGTINLAGTDWTQVLFATSADSKFGGPNGTVATQTATFTNSSVDTLVSSDAVAALITNTGAINYTDAVGVRSNVSISNFGADDQITITGQTAAIYNSAISFAGSDVTISYNNAITGTLNIITLVGVNTAGAFVNDVASFNALSVGDLIFA